MILTVDINNTSVVFAVMEDGRVLFRTRLASDKHRTADEYAVLLEWALRQRSIAPGSVEDAIISSVVPPLTAVIRDAVIFITGRTPLIIGPGVKTGLNIRLEDPTELGGDFVASAVAAISEYPMPCVIIVMGTAIAMGIIDKTGSYIGGIISPGPMVSQEALARGAALLSNVSITPTPQVICKTTASCMQSGIVNGSAAMIDGLLERIEAELGQTVTAVATGDWAETIVPCCKRGDIVLDKDILMHGLWMIYKKNRRS